MVREGAGTNPVRDAMAASFSADHGANSIPKCPASEGACGSRAGDSGLILAEESGADLAVGGEAICGAELFSLALTSYMGACDGAIRPSLPL